MTPAAVIVGLFAKLSGLSGTVAALTEIMFENPL
jgi:hypothetical protein